MYKVLDTNGYEEFMNKYNLSSVAAKFMRVNNLEFTSKIANKEPYDYENMDKVISFILKTMNEKKKIAIYGDYDVDGICSVSILYRTFNLMDYEVGYYVPNRYKDGYGLSSKIVENMHNKGYSLIICVDNGIKAYESIELAKKYGMNVIVLDHHQKGNEFPDFNLYLHPEYSNFSKYNMCGASICYYVSKALLNYEDDICLVLAGIATVGDVMPLIDQNKLLVAKSLKILNKFKYKPIDLLNQSRSTYDELVVSMNIVPKLNSIGRMCKNNEGNKLVKYLTSNNQKELDDISKFIEDTNKKRKETTEEYFNKLDDDKCNDKIFVVRDDTMLEGINGIIAARFANKYKIPSIAFSLDESGECYKGSARSVSDFNIVELFEKNKYIEMYGGHKGAAGLTIRKENYDLFVKQIIDDTKNNEYKEEILNVINLEENELNYKGYLDLLKFSPFGEGNPSPLFIIQNINAERIKLSKDKKHILIDFNNEANLVGFNMGKELNDEIKAYNVIFKIEANNLYKNKISCKCLYLEECKNV